MTWRERHRAKAPRICQRLECGATFIAGPAAKWCPECRWRLRGRRKKREWSPEKDAYLLAHWDIRIRNRTTEIAAHFGWPRWVINKRAQVLGLARTKEPNWTPEQEAFLLAHVGKRTANWMWENMPAPRRTETAIIIKLKRLVGSRRITDGGYTLGQLELLLGVDHREIDRWAREGLLQVQMRGYRTTRDTWCVDPADVRAFVREHRDLYDLRRVDQPSFLALLFDEAPPKVETRAQQRAKQRNAA